MEYGHITDTNNVTSSDNFCAINNNIIDIRQVHYIVIHLKIDFVKSK